MRVSGTPKRRTHVRPVLAVADFERYLTTSAAIIAPADVTSLLSHTPALHERLAADRADHPELVQQARVALRLLTDHAHGECPQIPYQTVSLLAAALLYYLAPMDVIPDFIPRIGTADDAVVLGVAWRLAAPGVQRYLDWKSLVPSGDQDGTDLDETSPPTARPARTESKPGQSTRRSAGGRATPRRRPTRR